MHANYNKVLGVIVGSQTVCCTQTTRLHCINKSEHLLNEMLELIETIAR